MAADRVEQVIALAEALTEANERRIRALGEQQQKWRTDPGGRRARGARKAAATRAERRAMTALIAAVQADDAPTVVRQHFATNGPTYYEAARCAALMRRRM